MRAVILAAGCGTRLRPLTDNRPKCMVELAGSSLLERQLMVLRAAGIDQITVVTGFRSDKIDADGCHLVHNPDYDVTNMVATLFSAATIVALATAGPAFGYGPATSSPSLGYLSGEAEFASSDVAKKETQVAFAIIKRGTNGYYVLVKGDNGKEFPNCEKRANCSTEIVASDFEVVGVDCATAKGCLIIGRK